MIVFKMHRHNVPFFLWACLLVLMLGEVTITFDARMEA